MLIARVFGFLRYRVLTGVFNTSELDVFFAAFRIPDLIFEILVTGALTTTFIPFFIKFKNNDEDLSNYISSIMNIVCILVAIAIVILTILMPYIVPLYLPGFDAVKNKEIIDYSRVLLIGQLPFLVVGNFLTGIAQARKTFILPALAPAVYNIAIIIATVFLFDSMHLMAPVLGVVIGSSLFLLVQLPVLRYSNFEYKLVIHKTKEAFKFLRMAIPRVMTSIVSQIDATVDLTLASLIGSGSYTIFYFAQHLQLLPISLIGMAFGQASLPYLSELWQQDKKTEFRRVILESMLNLFYLTLPIMLFMIVSRTPIIRLFYGGDQFDWNATVLTAKTLSYFALSLPFHSVYYFLTRCFYAFFDTKTPFYISLFTIVTNALLSWYFVVILDLPVWSLAVSFSIGMNINVVILFIMLNKKLGGFEWYIFTSEVLKITAAVIVAGAVAFFSQRLLDGIIFDTTRTINVFFLLVVNGIIFLTVYLLSTWLVGVREMYLISRMVLKLREYQRKVVEIYSGIQ